MARTSGGQLIGQASYQEKRDLQREMIDAELDIKLALFDKKYMDAVDELKKIMGVPQFEAWYDSYPSGTIKRVDFLKIMENEIKHLESLMCDVSDALREARFGVGL